MKERIWERDKWEGNTRVLLFSRNETQINHCSIAFALLDMYGRNKERMESEISSRQAVWRCEFFHFAGREAHVYSEHGVMLALFFHVFFPLPSFLSMEGRKEGKKERKEDGWDGMGCM